MKSLRDEDIGKGSIMKEWNDLILYKENYIYVEDNEEIIIRHGEDADRANELYERIVRDYHLVEHEIKWQFDIALDCIRNMSQENADYFVENPYTYKYHMSYGMYIRNRYIHHATKHSYWEADNVSTVVLRFILTILHPLFDYRNTELCAFFDDYDYPVLINLYEEEYEEIFVKAELELASPENRLTAKEAIERIKQELREKLGPGEFKQIFVRVVKEFCDNEKRFWIYDNWKDFQDVLFRQSVLYPLEYQQVKCMREIGLYREVESEKLQELNECIEYINENIGLKEEYARNMAECALEAYCACGRLDIV